MVDNRSAVIPGISGGINFKSGDISGTAAKTSDDRASQGTEYFLQEEAQNTQNEQFVDRSMQLRASLNSLALLNVASLLRNKRKTSILEEENMDEHVKSYRIEKIEQETKDK